ncbi:putative leucine-rich repeat-containing protein DDB_G0290503 isoform X2 [Biomphalaria glabrata]|uniref:Cilia- and flagella-associated protein 157 n=1 Tax=Biomphalaria glabrata TaxID=6526 RepID=A0A9W3BA49_BIOGL|nr:putative leucine-rich repeat-containing protein DDB_G0290503 isoform X2 [Biomphalaria glabrata]
MSKKAKKGKDVTTVKKKNKVLKSEKRARPVYYNINKTLDENTKEFYLWQIKTLENRIESYQKLLDDNAVKESLNHDKIHQSIANKNDLITFFKEELQRRVEAYNDLQDKYSTCQQLLDTEQHLNRERISQMRREATDNQAQLLGENMKLISKLASVEDFLAQKHFLEKRLAEAESELSHIRNKYTEDIVNLEKDYVIYKQRLKTESIDRLKNVALEFHKATQKSMPATFERTLKENMEINSKLFKISDKNVSLMEENDSLKEQLTKATNSMNISEADRGLLFKRLDNCLGVLRDTKTVCSDLQNTVVKQEEDIEDYHQIKAENVILESEIAKLKSKLEELLQVNKQLRKDSLSKGVIRVLDHEKRQKLERMFSNAVFAIRKETARLIPERHSLTKEVKLHQKVSSFTKSSSEKCLEIQDTAVTVSSSGSIAEATIKLHPNRLTKPASIDSSVPETFLSSIDETEPLISMSQNVVKRPRLKSRVVFNLDKTEPRKSSHKPEVHTGGADQNKRSSILQSPSLSSLVSIEMKKSKREEKIPSVTSSRVSSATSTRIPSVSSTYSQPLSFSKRRLSSLYKYHQKELDLFDPFTEENPHQAEKVIVCKCDLPEDLDRIKSNLLESLSILVHAATSLGIELSSYSDETEKEPHTLTFVPDLEQQRFSSHDSSTTSKKRSLKLSDMDYQTAANLSRLRDALSSRLKHHSLTSQESHDISSVKQSSMSGLKDAQLYTKEDMMEYLLVLLDSAAHLGVGVQQKQLEVLWQHATGESSAPEIQYVNRPSRAHYKPGDLGLIPKPVLNRNIPRKQKVDNTYMLRCSNKTVQTATVAETLATSKLHEFKSDAKYMGDQGVCMVTQQPVKSIHFDKEDISHLVVESESETINDPMENQLSCSKINTSVSTLSS